MDFNYFMKILKALLILLFFYLLGLFLKRTVFKYLCRWAEKTRWRADDIIVPFIKAYILLWSLLLGISVSSPILFKDAILNNINKIVIIIFIFSLTLLASKIITSLIRVYAGRIQTTIAMSGLTQSISRLLIFTIGFLMILNSLGITITPILTTLGIGGLAVALALQDTLSNLFSGFHIMLAKQIRIGDYIRLETDQEGYVEDINWRTTKIRLLPTNNIVLVPNSKLSQTIVTNFYLPQKELSILVDVGVHYDSDLEEVEQVTIEVAKMVMREVEGGVPDFEPLVRYHTFGDFSINFTVILRAKEFFDRYKVKHEFIKRLHKKYKERGIVIPYPIRAINYAQEDTLKEQQR